MSDRKSSSSIFRIVQGLIRISSRDGSSIADVNSDSELLTSANISNISSITGQQNSDDSIPVVLSNEQEIIVKDINQKPNEFLFNEVNCLGLQSIDVLNHTVPIGFYNEIYKIHLTGENVAIFSIKKNSQVVAKARTYYTNFNTSIDLGGFRFNAGDLLTISVTNNNSSTSSFEASVTYKELSL